MVMHFCPLFKIQNLRFKEKFTEYVTLSNVSKTVIDGSPERHLFDITHMKVDFIQLPSVGRFSLFVCVCLVVFRYNFINCNIMQMSVRLLI